MTRTLLALALLLPLGCERKPAADPAFDRQWTELAQQGAEPLFVEGDLHGAGLMGELRRAVDPPGFDRQIGAPTVLEGPLPDDQVVRVIRQNLGAVRSCYQLAEREGTTGSGKAIVSLEIDTAGAVSNVSVDAPAFRSSRLPACVTGRARAWSFPKFTKGPKKFSYPFVFVGG